MSLRQVNDVVPKNYPLLRFQQLNEFHDVDEVNRVQQIANSAETGKNANLSIRQPFGSRQNGICIRRGDVRKSSVGENVGYEPQFLFFVFIFAFEKHSFKEFVC